MPSSSSGWLPCGLSTGIKTGSTPVLQGSIKKPSQKKRAWKTGYGSYRISPVRCPDKSNEMFMRIERLMTGDRIYRENGLTRDKVAERLGSNRTYISQVINDKTGMSFLAYINSYRIEEAIELLSDPANDIPLKALSSDLGFSSISTFYKLFSEKVGMPPAKYREKIIEISKSGN